MQTIYRYHSIACDADRSHPSQLCWPRATADRDRGTQTGHRSTNKLAVEGRRSNPMYCWMHESPQSTRIGRHRSSIVATIYVLLEMQTGAFAYWSTQPTACGLTSERRLDSQWICPKGPWQVSCLAILCVASERSIYCCLSLAPCRSSRRPVMASHQGWDLRLDLTMHWLLVVDNVVYGSYLFPCAGVDF